MNCKYWNEQHQECSVNNNTYEQGYNQALDDISKEIDELDRMGGGILDLKYVIEQLRK